MRARHEGAARTVRGGRRFRTWLACFSLLLQIGATAGHFHSEDFAVLAAGKADAAAAIGMPAQPGGQPALPAHDDCSLCFSLQLVGNSTLPLQPVLPAPDGHAAAAPVLAAPLRLIAAAHLLFQTRAPPIA